MYCSIIENYVLKRKHIYQKRNVFETGCQIVDTRESHLMKNTIYKRGKLKEEECITMLFDISTNNQFNCPFILFY